MSSELLKLEVYCVTSGTNWLVIASIGSFCFPCHIQPCICGKNNCLTLSLLKYVLLPFIDLFAAKIIHRHYYRYFPHYSHHHHHHHHHNHHKRPVLFWDEHKSSEENKTITEGRLISEGDVWGGCLIWLPGTTHTLIQNHVKHLRWSVLWK